MNLFQKIFGFGKKKTGKTTIKIELFGKEYSNTINATPQQINEVLEKSFAKTYIGEWNGKNEIESIRDDGYIIYKSNRVTTRERNQIGFYGLKWFSENGKYSVVYLKDEDTEYNLGLVDVEQKLILYRRKLKRPARCRVTSLGFVICEDWGSYNKNSNFIYVFDINGNEIFKQRHNSAIGDTFELIEDETKFMYNLNYSGRIFKINLPTN